MVIFALLISSVVPATIRKSSNYARLADIDRHLRDGDKRCPNDRPFVCYVFDELHQEYPAWLKQRGDDSDEDETKFLNFFLSKIAPSFFCRLANGTQLPDIDRHRRDSNKRCPSNRPFVCYVFDELTQDYPPWLRQNGDDTIEDEMKCASCAVATTDVCGDIPFQAIALQSERSKTSHCRPNLCVPEGRRASGLYCSHHN
ncbi:unnamed protein product, partial [Mesorhabditis spiculigera]